MMIERINTPEALSIHGFLMAVEVEAGTDLEAIQDAIVGLVEKYPGIRSWDIEHLGQMEIIDDPQAMKKILAERIETDEITEPVDPDLAKAMTAKGKN